MKLSVKDSLFAPNSTQKFAQTSIRRTNDRRNFNVWIYLEGIDLPLVKAVKYIFPQQLNIPPKRIHPTPQNPHCAISIWTDSTFTMQVKIEDYEGNVRSVRHSMEFPGRDIPREMLENPIRKNERASLHLIPGFEHLYPIIDGFDFLSDELEIIYASQRYEGKKIYLKYKDANGYEVGYFVFLDGQGSKKIMNSPSLNTIDNYGFVGFSSDVEIFAEFKVIKHQNAEWL